MSRGGFGIFGKNMSDVSVVAKSFWAFIIPVLEYCSPFWLPTTTSHLLLLDRVVGRVSQLSGGSISCDIRRRQRVASLFVAFKIFSLVGHSLFPAQYFPAQLVTAKAPVELLLFTIDLLRCKGLEIGSFRALLFYLVFDCGIGCMNPSLLVKT